MDTHATEQEPRVLDTYALVYAFGMALMVPALFLIERFDFEPYEPGFMFLVLSPFIFGIVATLLTDSRDGLSRLGKRVVVLTPLVLFLGVTILFVLEIAIILPISQVLEPGNFGVLGPVFAASLALVAAPLVVALARRFRGPFSAARAFQMVALVAALGIVGWTLAVTFNESRILGTFLRHDLLDYFSGSQTWFFPCMGLAAGIWRKLGIV